MNLASVRRPVSVILACGASGLLVTGFLVAGLVLGLMAVATAWVPTAAPPAE